MITTLEMYIIAGVMFLINLILVGIFIWLRKPLLDSIKLKKLMWLNYIIVDYESHDKTITRYVKRIIKGMVELPDGNHPVIEQAIKLVDRKYPLIRIKEGEAMPVVDDELVVSPAICPTCKKENVFKFLRPASIDTKVLDNTILKAKSEGGLLKWFDENKKLIIGMIVAGSIALVGSVMIFYLINNIDKLFGPIIENHVTTALARAGLINNALVH